MDLKGKKVLITGAAKRLGREMALQFAQKGADVLIHYHRSLKEASCLVCELGKYDVKAKAYRADLSRASDIKRLKEKIVKDVGKIDILVHNASSFYPKPFEKVTEQDWDTFLGIHAKAPFFLAQHFAPLMNVKNLPAMIFLSDAISMRKGNNFIPYEVSKMALNALIPRLARALSPKIRVVGLAPGLILPPKELSAEAKKRLSQENLVHRWGSKEDLARAVTFLAEQDFINATILKVDGGGINSF